MPSPLDRSITFKPYIKQNEPYFSVQPTYTIIIIIMYYFLSDDILENLACIEWDEMANFNLEQGKMRWRKKVKRKLLFFFLILSGVNSWCGTRWCWYTRQWYFKKCKVFFPVLTLATWVLPGLGWVITSPCGLHEKKKHVI